MVEEQGRYPTGMDWQQKISTALGVKLGQRTLTLDEAVAKIRSLSE